MNDGLDIDKYGVKRWYLNGYLHRTDGPACYYTDGTKCWYLNGKHHRSDGPAVEFKDGSKYWYLNNKLHRTDGPAIEYIDGDKAWYLNGEELSQEDYIKTNRNNKLELLGLWMIDYT